MPNSIGALVDAINWIRGQIAPIEGLLKVIGDFFQRAVPVTELHQAHPVGEQKTIDAETVPLNDMHQFMEKEAFGLMGMTDEKRRQNGASGGGFGGQVLL